MRLAFTDLVGESFEQIMQTNVLEPLGMSNSTYQQPLPEILAGRAARAHDGNGRRMGAAWQVYPELAPDGLRTTPTDLARFAIEIQPAVRGPSETVLRRKRRDKWQGQSGSGLIRWDF
jgi:CubicO group peptidase (beta-lactamase class C family)